MINYGRLWEAKTFYKEEALGEYRYIEVPWDVPKEYSDITLPEGKQADPFRNNVLVGSAEQSFLYLVNHRHLHHTKLKGQYQTITPCFRNEEVYDVLHKPYFMKLELFDNDYDDPWVALNCMIIDAKDYFNKLLGGPFSVYTKQVAEHQYDILDSQNHIELGSYGIGYHPLVGNWIYGTGCAEPRTSQVCGLYKN